MTAGDTSFRFCVSCRRIRPMRIVELFERAGRKDELASVFGFLIDSPLNGGRDRASSIVYPPEEIERLNAAGVGYSFTLTSTAAAPEHLRDRWTNEMLKRFENPLNDVIVATPLIEDFVREKYPGYKVRASCIYNFKTVEEINRACERFDLVTPWPDINDHDDRLAALTRKDRVMLFGTQICLKACGDHRLRHYYFWSLDHIAYYNHREYRVPYHPGDFRWTYLPPCVGRDYPTQLEDLERFRRLGFTHIKITQPVGFARKVLGVTAPTGSRVYAFLQGPVWTKLKARLTGRQAPRGRRG